jgi:acyl-homoserine lactone acylase PvdQ
LRANSYFRLKAIGFVARTFFATFMRWLAPMRARREWENFTLGATPNDDQINAIVAWPHANQTEGVSTAPFAREYRDAEAFLDRSAGCHPTSRPKGNHSLMRKIHKLIRFTRLLQKRSEFEGQFFEVRNQKRVIFRRKRC